METVALPGTGIDVSRFCFGAGALGTAVSGDRADALLAAFVAAGGSFFDTAHCYAFWIKDGLGASERELGASLRRIGAWDRAVVATKGGHPDGGPGYPRPADFLSDTVIHSDIDDSLDRLQTDRIDLFYLHRDDGHTPAGEIIEMLNREIRLGRVRAIGASNWSVARLAGANAYAAQRGLAGFVISQVQWSLSQPGWVETDDPTMRSVGAREIAWHTETGIPIAAFSATGNGFFARDLSAGAGSANSARWHAVRRLSGEIGCTPTQLVVAWLLHQAPTVIPTFSTANPVHLAEVLAADRIALSSEMVARLSDPTALHSMS